MKASRSYSSLSTGELAKKHVASAMVSWSGADDAGGSGIASYDVYVSDNGAAFTLWQDHTDETSATFAGEVDHTYGFYSVAVDNVGHVEAAPASAGGI